MTTLKNYSLSLIAPQDLLTHERFDIAVKWMFFRYLLKGIEPDSERLYRWHIEQRTGGREPRSWKHSVEDYITVCKQLLDNMLSVGFNPRFPLEYGQNGKLRDGAHRLACSLLLGLDAYYITVSAYGSATWGENWFIRKGIAPKDLQHIKGIWRGLNA